MKRYSTVSRLIGGEFVALCACGWMGPARVNRPDAYRDRAAHSKEHEGVT